MIPFISVKTPSCLTLMDSFLEIEQMGIHSNYGPKNTLFEDRLQGLYFGGQGSCLTVCNATIGLMIAMKMAGRRRTCSVSQRYALMPAFTFAAAAHAAIWAGYTPLFCDIDPATWAACPVSERRMIEKYGDSIDLIVPYATFGNSIDLAHYAALHEETGAGIVVDAAASLGALDENGIGFGSGFAHPIVFSMHATKTFGIGEGGVIYSGNPDHIAVLRVMGNFGFGEPRTATIPGLNSKMTEFSAAIALACLTTMEDVATRRSALADCYFRTLPIDFEMQKPRGHRRSYQFMPVLLPEGCCRNAVREQLSSQGIGTGAYFSPHLMEQPYFSGLCEADDLTVTENVSRRVMSLPLWTDMTMEMVGTVCQALENVLVPASMSRVAA
ncbi:DegT/DnrJ/EryC1/StrS family aminotransferase [Acetobacter fallax]|nr:DegT/DnrJ/EryC1/StrS family aminotransferase [Acetobacter fallax]